MFYSNLYRRHNVDMHIGDWDPAFLSRFSPEDFVENLKLAQINYVFIFSQSHAGLCYYPTKLGVIHKAFEKQPDRMKQVVDLCHANGIKVCGYYSLFYNTKEHDRHPQWRLKMDNGHSQREYGATSAGLSFTNARDVRYGLCCPNNPEYREFVYGQIDEILDYFDFDAMFFDMPYWAHTCYCEHCQKAFGGPIPKEDTRELIEFKTRTMGGFIQSVTDYIKQRCPQMPVNFNCASTVDNNASNGSAEEVLRACDYAGGDRYGDVYDHSFVCKYFKNATNNQPFQLDLSRCKPALGMHTLSKTTDELKTMMASTMQHHGATMMLDAIDPVGTLDRRVYDRIGEVFRFQQQYEPYFTGKMVEEVGLYLGLRSRFADQPYHSLNSCVNAVKTLVREHIPHGVTGSFYGLDQYKILAAPMLSELEEKDNDRLVGYVENGGTLYLSGCGNHALVEKLTGNRFQRVTEEDMVYIAPTEEYGEVFGDFNRAYPLPFEGTAPIVTPTDAKVIATLTLPYTKPNEKRFASIHSNPPGIATDIPAVTVNTYGKGKVIWSAVPLEAVSYDEYRQIFLNLLHLDGQPGYFFTSDAPKNVELTAFQDDGSITVNAAVLTDESISTPAVPFCVKVHCVAKSVKRLPDGEQIPFTVRDGYTVFTTKTLHIFDMYRLD